jgi:50S ribosomal protein L16 3-hydroxylase
LRREFSRLPARGWTLLVQGVDQMLPRAARLLREFAFIPYARLDDVMVSFAAPGGGVGPHFDSYDVFLLQGAGERRWQVARQRNLDLAPDAPLKILQRFEPQREWRVESGDLLYLPPGWAHEGVAISECITCSIGFRAPSAQELGTRFLEFLQDNLALEGVYADPDLKATRRPGRIDPAMVERVAAILGKVQWSDSDIVEFIGCYLTEPKAHVTYERPARALSARDFARHARARGLRAALTSRLLFHGRRFFVNGESYDAGVRAAKALGALADERELRPSLHLDAEARRLLYDWYLAGYIELGANDASAPR